VEDEINTLSPGSDEKRMFEFSFGTDRNAIAIMKKIILFISYDPETFCSHSSVQVHGQRLSVAKEQRV
jgi:hypothetical protein